MVPPVALAGVSPVAKATAFTSYRSWFELGGRVLGTHKLSSLAPSGASTSTACSSLDDATSKPSSARLSSTATSTVRTSPSASVHNLRPARLRSVSATSSHRATKSRSCGRARPRAPARLLSPADGFSVPKGLMSVLSPRRRTGRPPPPYGRRRSQCRRVRRPVPELRRDGERPDSATPRGQGWPPVRTWRR
jgi:hypothetical protein